MAPHARSRNTRTKTQKQTNKQAQIKTSKGASRKNRSRRSTTQRAASFRRLSVPQQRPDARPDRPGLESVVRGPPPSCRPRRAQAGRLLARRRSTENARSSLARFDFPRRSDSSRPSSFSAVPLPRMTSGDVYDHILSILFARPPTAPPPWTQHILPPLLGPSSPALLARCLRVTGGPDGCLTFVRVEP